MFSVGFHTSEDLMDVSESLEKGLTIDWLRSLAESNNIYITCSLYEKHSYHYYNTMVMVGNDGRLQYYRKRNPTWMELTVWRRSEEPGPGLFETPFGRVGGVICFDSFARESYLGFANSGISIGIIIACWGVPIRPRRDLFWAVPMMRKWSYLASRVVPQQYAKQLEIPIVFVNQSGIISFPCNLPPPYPKPKVTFEYEFTGRSSVWDESGRILMDGSDEEQDFATVVPVEIADPHSVSKVVRSNLPADYMSKDYYFVQPPFLAKLGQAWCFRTFNKEYDLRRNRHNT
jgi:predicted amidohydrolase